MTQAVQVRCRTGTSILALGTGLVVLTATEKIKEVAKWAKKNQSMTYI